MEVGWSNSVKDGPAYPFDVNIRLIKRRKLTVETDEVGVVVYTGNQLQSGMDIYSVPSRKYLGICLKTQELPDAIHHPYFPSYVLQADKNYSS